MSGAIQSEHSSGACMPARLSVFGPLRFSGTRPFESWDDVLTMLGHCGQWSILRSGDEVIVFAPIAVVGEPSCWGHA